MSGTTAAIASTESDRLPARQLYVELATRITTQPLHYRSGDEETAAGSIRTLFDTSRALLIEHPQAVAFERVTVSMINEIIRPYTARWHRWMVDKRFRDEAARRQFRVELRELRPMLNGFRDLFSEMSKSDVADVGARLDAITKDAPRRRALAEMGEPFASYIEPRQVRFAEVVLPPGFGQLASAEMISAAERRFILRRRDALGRTHSKDGESQLTNAAALCLSGGGIRSATFCLGIVQVLARQGMLEQFDYLSTVSGGGYLGSFLSAYLGAPGKAQFAAEPEKKGNTAAMKRTEPVADGAEIRARIASTFTAEGGRESVAVRYLRNNSRYLLNGGLWGRARMFGLLISGIVTNLLLVLPVALLAALAAFGLKQAGYWSGCPLLATRSPAETTFFGFLLLLGLFWILLPLVRNVTFGKRPLSAAARFGTFWTATTLLLAIAAMNAGIAYSLPAIFAWVAQLRGGIATIGGQWKTVHWESTLATVSAAMPFVFGTLASRLKAGAGRRIATALFALSGILFFTTAFLITGGRLWDGLWSPLVFGAVAGTLTLWGWLFVNINSLSPHGYYRDRLCECYLAVPGEDQSGFLRAMKQHLMHGQKATSPDRDGVGVRRQLPLSEMNQSHAAPYHLLHTAANLPASREPDLRGRDCDFFMFSRDYCGGPVCGYFATESVLEKLDSHVDLGTAMAISGAAASSNMGVKTMHNFRFLLTLLNIRLGYWLRHPRAGNAHWWNAPGPLHLLSEMVGWMHEKGRYVNLSDGGHIENLALYEMLRRRCKFIVVVDGGQEAKMECADLLLAQRYAEIDLNVRLEFVLDDLILDDRGCTKAYAILGKAHYSETEIGWVVYLKLACTGAEPGYILDYRRQNAAFPHQSTGDQIYDEAQFEAYRRLGECAGESLFRTELVQTFYEGQAGKPPHENAPRFATMEQWFQAMATSLLADNDVAFDASLSGIPPGDAVQPAGTDCGSNSADAPVVT